MDGFLIRDLPLGTDLDDVHGDVSVRFDQLRFSDDVDEFRRILHDYSAAGAESREVMNTLLINLCGYSLPTLVEGTGRQV